MREGGLAKKLWNIEKRVSTQCDFTPRQRSHYQIFDLYLSKIRILWKLYKVNMLQSGHLPRADKRFCPKISVHWSKSHTTHLPKWDTYLKRPKIHPLDRFHCIYIILVNGMFCWKHPVVRKKLCSWKKSTNSMHLIFDLVIVSEVNEILLFSRFLEHISFFVYFFMKFW